MLVEGTDLDAELLCDLRACKVPVARLCLRSGLAQRLVELPTERPDVGAVRDEERLVSVEAVVR